MRKQRDGKPQRVVLVPCPFQGHISPMLELGTALHSKGFSITVVHAILNSPNPSNHPDFLFYPISNGLIDGDISSENLAALITTLNTSFEAPFEECLVQLMDQEVVACIIYDALWYAVDAVADHLQLPRVIFYTCGAAVVAACASVAGLKQEGYFPPEGSKLQDLVPGHDALRLKDLPISANENLERELENLAVYGNIKRASSIIWNSIDCLEHLALEGLQQQHQIPFFSVGPLFKIAPATSSSLMDADANCITWLDKQAPKSVLYISLGSIMSVDEKELAEMAWGLANCGQPFLWVIRPGLVRGSQWIEMLPKGFRYLIGERGLIVKWAPQKEVLAHEAVGGFWSHCGWNSTLESISEGVPMICSPGFGDQRVNARYVSHVWKVGLELDGGLERGKIEEMVKKLMADKEGKEVRKRATDLKEKVELCMHKGGSSNNSLNDLADYILSL